MSVTTDLFAQCLSFSSNSLSLSSILSKLEIVSSAMIFTGMVSITLCLHFFPSFCFSILL